MRGCMLYIVLALVALFLILPPGGKVLLAIIVIGALIVGAIAYFEESEGVQYNRDRMREIREGRQVKW